MGEDCFWEGWPECPSDESLTPNMVLAALPPAVPALSVRYLSMPENNGRENWTAILCADGKDDMTDGYCFARSEYPDRVRYDADRMRYLIGETDKRPCILDYDADKCSDYVPATTPDPVAEARAKALEDAKWYGAGFMRVLSDGIWDHIDHECISIHAPLDPNPPETDPVADAAKVLLADDIALSRMSKAMHDGPLGADEHWFSAATEAGGWCLDCVRAALRALTKDGEAG
jgi:hypothetical protein